MPEYAGICMDMPKSAWLTFVWHFPISPFVLQFFSTLASGYLFELLQETRGNSLEEHEAVFFKRQSLIFSVAAESTSSVFCLRLNFFASKI